MLYELEVTQATRHTAKAIVTKQGYEILDRMFTQGSTTYTFVVAPPYDQSDTSTLESALDEELGWYSITPVEDEYDTDDDSKESTDE